MTIVCGIATRIMPIVRGTAVGVTRGGLPLSLQQSEITIGRSEHGLFGIIWPFGCAWAWQIYGASPKTPDIQQAQGSRSTVKAISSTTMHIDGCFRRLWAVTPLTRRLGQPSRCLFKHEANCVAIDFLGIPYLVISSVLNVRNVRTFLSVRIKGWTPVEGSHHHRQEVMLHSLCFILPSQTTLGCVVWSRSGGNTPAHLL